MKYSFRSLKQKHYAPQDLKCKNYNLKCSSGYNHGLITIPLTQMEKLVLQQNNRKPILKMLLSINWSRDFERILIQTTLRNFVAKFVIFFPFQNNK